MRRTDRQMPEEFAWQVTAAANLDQFAVAIARNMARTAVWRVDITSVTGKSRRPKP